VGVLVNVEIQEEMSRGNIVISPFRAEHLNTVSYDVTLGRHVGRLSPKTPVLDVSTSDSADWFTLEDLGVGPLILQPQERVLAHTEEFIGGRNVVTSEMRARSSWGRWGLQACACAGWGDIGFFNRYVAEVINLNPFQVSIPVGTVFAQIVFHRVDREPSEGTQYFQTGQYQTSGDLQKLKESWCPEMMLPKPLKRAPPAGT
jgi:dCTP deaminase